MDDMPTNNALVDLLVQNGTLKSNRVIKSFNRVHREDFLPPDFRSRAGTDMPIPIGFGQTNSQPYTVARMIELLGANEGDVVLDVGSGSGWTTALLAHIVGPKGKVIAMERIPDIAKFGEENIRKYGFIQSGVVEIVVGDGSKGYPRHAPYDKILASASSRRIPSALLDQLRAPGNLVMPVDQSIWRVLKDAHGEMEKEEFPGFSFVPLIEGK